MKSLCGHGNFEMAARRKPAGAPLREPGMGSAHLWKTRRRASYEVCFDREGLQMWLKRLDMVVEAVFETNPIGSAILVGLLGAGFIRLLWEGARCVLR